MVTAPANSPRTRHGGWVLGLALIVASCTGSSAEPTITTRESLVGYSELPTHVRIIAERYGIPEERLTGFPEEIWDDIRVSPSEVQTEEDSGGYFEHRSAWARWVAECYTRSGYPASEDPPGSGVVSYRGPNAPDFVTSTAKQRCDAESLLRFPDPPPPETRGDWETIYRRVLDTAACLEAEGHNVPDPPTLDAFIDSDGDWDPYLAVDDVSNDEWNRLLGVCPQP